MKTKTLWITETAVMIALLIALQAVTKPAGQFVTGSCVNLVLGVSTLVGGLWCGVTVAVLSPFFAFMLSIGPALLPVVPLVAVGNLVLVVLLHFITGKLLDNNRLLAFAGVVAAAAAKFLALYLLIVKLLIPALALPAKQAAVLSASFSWPQIVTALIGGVLAVCIAPLIRKALQKKQP
ncbi:MAG: ECF transporter S component [Clostridiales bacterium]|nr:ECF transporter S component [Clostridiales bacterium]